MMYHHHPCPHPSPPALQGPPGLVILGALWGKERGWADLRVQSPERAGRQAWKNPGSLGHFLQEMPEPYGANMAWAHRPLSPDFLSLPPLSP